MRIGLPKEIMTGEGRVALTPDDCKALLQAGNEIVVETLAGQVSGYDDLDYQDAGAEIVTDAEAVYAQAQLIVKVKQPLPQDIRYLRSEHILFSYLHLAADLSLVEKLCEIGLTAIPFESVTDDAKGGLPLLAPMSQVAGRIAVMRGASLLFKNRGGRGVLLGGVAGSDSGQVVVLGAGVAGSHAVAVADALGACVTVVDLNADKLQQLKQQYPAIETCLSSPEAIERLCLNADLVIGAVLLAGRRAPVILHKSIVQNMQDGSVIIDIAIDQGGCVEGIRATDSETLCYIDSGVIHSAVPNMPAAVPRTASQALSSAILPYVEALAALSSTQLADSETTLGQALYRAIAVKDGEVVDSILLQEITPD